jgi:hypothetical protein
MKLLIKRFLINCNYIHLNKEIKINNFVVTDDDENLN